VIRLNRLTVLFWKLLSHVLMWPGSIEVLNISVKDTVQLLLLQDEQVIETLSPHAAQKALTDRISSWCVGRCFEHLDAEGIGHASERGSKLVITITNEIVRRLSIRSRLPQRYGRPRRR
jgi:hypothetical protein